MNTPPVPNVQKNGPAPTGNIPAGRRQWIAVGACLLLVGAIALSSLGGPASPKLKTGGLPSATVTPMSPAELETATRNLKQQQVEAEQAREKADQAARRFAQSVPNAGGSAELSSQGGLGGQTVAGPNGSAYYPAGSEHPVPPQIATAQDSLRLERAKREYASLFASNLALSLRPDHPTVASAGAGTFPTPPLLPNESDDLQKTAIPRLEKAPAASGILAAGNVSRSTPDADPELQKLIADREIPKHVIFEGTVLEAVLTNRLTGDFSGPVNCMVTTDVYSHNRQLLLIPQGSRILGETRKVAEQNQERLAVVFHRLIMPDGFSVDLDQFPGLDQVGTAALKDKVDHHYLQVFGTSVALGVLSGFELAGTATAVSANGIDFYREGVASQTSANGMRVLEHQLNRLPTVTIREGQRVKVYLSKDISLPAYAAHAPIPGL